MSLDKLSDDLLLEIAEWVGTHAYHPFLGNIIAVRGTRFLGPLALCSRRLNTIVSPLLYRTFAQTNKKALPALLRLVLEKPQIGEEVKKFVGTEMSTYLMDRERDNRLDMSRFSPLDYDRCRIAMGSFSGLQFDQANWLYSLQQGNWCAVVALLLLCLPNLEEIEMAHFYGRDREFEYEYITRTFEYVASNQFLKDSPYSLKHLKTISAVLSEGVVRYGMSRNVVLSFFAPPSVSKIVISGFKWKEFRFEPKHSYQVQDLGFNGSCVDGDTMIRFLRCFPSIRKFQYLHRDSAIVSHVFLPQKMGEALAHLHHCLEELTLLGDPRFKQPKTEIRQGIGSLAQFKKLRRIKMCVEDLFGWNPLAEDGEDGGSHPVEKPTLADIFPASLQTLVLRKAKNSILIPLYEFLNDKESFPLLTNIVVRILELRDDYQEEAEGNLKSKYEDAGIQLHMIHRGDPVSGVAALLEDG
jgi:hypothetical protein